MIEKDKTLENKKETLDNSGWGELEKLGRKKKVFAVENVKKTDEGELLENKQTKMTEAMMKVRESYEKYKNKETDSVVNFGNEKLLKEKQPVVEPKKKK